MTGNIDDTIETPRQKQIRQIQEEFDRMYIHDGLSFEEGAERTGLSIMTIKSFLGRRKDGYQTKNPKSNTLLAMADLVGYDIQFVHRKTGRVLRPRGRWKLRRK